MALKLYIAVLMNEAILFKILHRQLKFRNPNHLLACPQNLLFTDAEFKASTHYLQSLVDLGISWTYPGHEMYPLQFLRMKEPPLFFEYKGSPFWLYQNCLSIVGTRKMHSLSEGWLKTHLAEYLENKNVCIVSGGAFGVDQLSHLVSLKKSKNTIVVVPSGLVDLYPQNLKQIFQFFDPQLICYVSEFEINQTLHKSHFFYRNRLIAALGEMTLVVQAELKSGSLLTVHHALENGRPVLTIPAHPMSSGFAGNIKLLRDGAYLISSSLDLLEFWNAEIKSLPLI